MKSVEDRAARVRPFALDVDRIMTDGVVHHGNNGEEFKIFNRKDGCGVKLSQTTGVKEATITGREQRANGVQQ